MSPQTDWFAQNSQQQGSDWFSANAPSVDKTAESLALVSPQGRRPSAPGIPKSSAEMIGEGEETGAQGQAAMGRQYASAGPGEVVGGAKDIASGNVPRGIHRVVQGAGTTVAPLAMNMLPMAAVEAPMATALGVGGGALGTIGGRTGVKVAGGSPDWQDVGGDVGGLAGATAGAKIGGAVAGLARGLHYNPKTEVSLPWWMGGGSISRAEPAPEVFPLSQSPNYARVQAARVLARRSAMNELTNDPNLPQAASGPLGRIGNGQSLIVAPDSPPPPVKTTYQSYPRERLVQMANKGDKNAIAELIRNPGGYELPPNAKYLIEENAPPAPFRNYSQRGAVEVPKRKP